MAETFKTHSKKAVNDAVSRLNARTQCNLLIKAPSQAENGTARRTAQFDVISAWEALLAAATPKDVLQNERLLDARAEINAEVERHAHAPPKFSKDGRVAVLRIHSAAQVHPVIATRWVRGLFTSFLSSLSPMHLSVDTCLPLPPTRALGVC